MYQINIQGQSFSVSQVQESVVGTVGVESVQFEFDSSWSGLTVMAAFRNTKNNKEYHVLLDDTLECLVPWEMYIAAGDLQIGALGIRDDVIVKPTVWKTVSAVVPGVSVEGSTPDENTPTLVAQLLAEVQELRTYVDEKILGGAW